MKPKNLLMILLLLISLFIVGCKEKTHTHSFDRTWVSDSEYHWHVCKKCKEVFDKYSHSFTQETTSKRCTICDLEVPYTVEENFDYWIKGRNYSLNYTGPYTTIQTTTTKDATTNMMTRDEYLIETCEDGKYLRIMDEHYSINDNGVLDGHEKNIRVFKEIDDNGIKRTKHFNSHEINEKITKFGEYVSPKNYMIYISYSPSDKIKDLYLDKGDNYYDFLKSVKDYILADLNIETVQTNFTRNTDGSVTLSISFNFETKFSSDDTSYLKSTYEYILCATVKDEKLIGTDYTITQNEVYTDSSKNKTTITNLKNEVSYEFNQEEYDKIDITTDETTNNYYSDLSLVINGHTYKTFYRFELVGEKFTSNTALDLITNTVVNISSSLLNEMFEIYVDEDMTIPFEEFTIKEPNVTLYVKIVPIENASIVVEVVDGDNTTGNYIYVLNPNSEYVFEGGLPYGYDIVSVNGKEITTETSFTCNANEVYIVLIKEKDNN